MAGTNPVNPALAALLPEGGVVCDGELDLAGQILETEGAPAARTVLQEDANFHRMLSELNYMFQTVTIPAARI